MINDKRKMKKEDYSSLCLLGMMRLTVMVLLLLGGFVQAKEIAVFKAADYSDSTAIGQIDTSGEFVLYERGQDLQYGGLLTLKLNIDSVFAPFSKDSSIYFFDVKVGNIWVPSDTITWYVVANDTGFSSSSKIITAAHKNVALVAWFNPRPSAGTPENIFNLGNTFFRMRRKSITALHQSQYVLVQPN